MSKVTGILIGAAVGGAIGWFVGSVVVEIIHLKEYNPDDFEWEDLDEDPGNDDETNLGERIVTYQRPEKNDKKVVKNYTEAFKGDDQLKKLVEKYNGDAISPESLDIPSSEPFIEDEFDLPEEEEEKDIRIISVSEFANADGVEVVTLKYYNDDVVTDENDKPVDKPERILGDDALVSFGALSEDEDVVYVHNKLKKAMYEVVRTNKDYVAPAPARVRRRIVKKEDKVDGEEADS